MTNAVCSVFRAGVLVAVALSVPFSASAQGIELEYDLRWDVPVTLAATGWLIGSELAKGHIAASTCRWCDRDADGRDTLNGVDAAFRSALRWDDTGASDVLSYVVGYGVAPAAVFGVLALAQHHDQALGRFPVDALLIAEAVAISWSVNQAVKFAVGRERPFVHVLAAEDKPHTAHPSDNNLSFYSGHTSFAFSLAVSAGTVAMLRGYRWARWLWVAGLSLAAVTGYLRIAADRHYFTDVLVGASTGSAIGFLVPFLFHRRVSPAIPVVGAAGTPGGALVSLTWVR